MKKDDELRRKLADTFEDYELDPQAETWEHIRKVIQPKRKRRFVWLFYLVAVFGLVLGVGQFANKNRQIAVAPVLQTQTASAMKSNSAVQTVSATENRVITASKSGINNKNDSKMVVRQASPKTVAGTATPALPPSNVITGAPQPSFAGSKMRETEVLGSANVVPAQASAVPALTMQSIDHELVVYKQFITDTTRFASFPALPLPEISLIHALNQLPCPSRSAARIQRKAQRKASFTADISLLSAFQLMESQWTNGVGATDIRVLPALDARRLGASLAAGFRLPLGLRGSLDLGLNWMNLPYRAVYSKANTNQVQVDILSPVQYRVSPRHTRDIADVKRLNWWGAQLDYGYHLSMFNQKIRVFAGAEGLWSSQAAEPEFWARAGFCIPLGNGRFQIVPVFKYQFGRIEQPDGLLKTRFYALGLGVKRIFH